MLGKSATELIERLKTDPSFGARIMAIGDIAGRMKLIHAEGYDCTLEEIQEQSQLLSTAELEIITGGQDLIEYAAAGFPMVNKRRK